MHLCNAGENQTQVLSKATRRTITCDKFWVRKHSCMGKNRIACQALRSFLDFQWNDVALAQVRVKTPPIFYTIEAYLVRPFATILPRFCTHDEQPYIDTTAINKRRNRQLPHITLRFELKLKISRKILSQVQFITLNALEIVIPKRKSFRKAVTMMKIHLNW